MSTELDKYKNSRRRLKDENAVKKQVKIAKQHGVSDRDEAIREPHRLVKHHAMNCGQPGCVLCGNPRKLFKELTAQEQRLFQDTDAVRNKHGNGNPPDSEQ